MQNIEIIKKEKSVVEIKGEIAWDKFQVFESSALASLSKNLEIDGFRKGHIPEDVARKNIGDDALLFEAARLAIAEYYPEILKDKKIDAIGSPEISLTKIARGNPLGFTITTGVMPEVTLPDYKKIAKANNTKEDVSVSDEEINTFIDRIRKDRAHHEMHEKGIAHEDHDSSKITDESLPSLTDELVSKWGDFKTVDEFKTKVTENLKADKETRVKEKNRLQIIEAIIKESKVEVPSVLVEIEIENMLARFKSDLQNMGIQYDQYLKQIGKTEQSVRDEMKSDAEKRAVLQLVVHDIAQAEKITADAKALEDEVQKVLTAYSDADETHVRQYLQSVLTNEAVFVFLEKQLK
jgi:trigger factor